MSLLRNICLMFYIILSGTFAQVNLEWAARYNGPDNNWDMGLSITVDDSGYSYITGVSPGTFTSRDYITIKYSPNGDTIWTRRWDNNNQWDIGWDLLVDKLGNVYVTGGPATLKYNSEGDLLWVSANAAECYRIVMDKEGNIIVAGSGSHNYVTRKLSPSGEQLWQQIYNGPANDLDRLSDKVIDNNDDVIVTGRSRDVGTDYDIATIKYSGSTGDTLWLRRYNGPSPNQPYDRGDGITVDEYNNVYVTGWSDGINGSAQCIVIKYSPEGELLWERRFPPGGGYGLAGYDIINDPAGYVYAAARSHGNEDRLLKYDYEGNLIWTAQYPAAHLFATNPPRLTLDKFGNVYMLSTNADTYAYYVVLKYDSDGNQQWEYRYHQPPIGGTFSVNNAYDIFIDSTLNIYVTGESAASGLGSDFDVLTLKLSQEIIPVELTSFTANVEGSNIHLLWTTATEINNMGFELFRNGSKITFIEGKGTTTETQSYSYIDKNLTPGIYNYRLEQIDFDGTRSILGELTVHLTIPETFSLYQNYPNPFNSVTNISFSLPDPANIIIKIYSHLGEEVKTLISENYPAGLHTIQWDAEGLPSGMYLCRLNAENEQRVIKLLLMK
jgi:hypothetical protein